jgi:hypothetical protein
VIWKEKPEKDMTGIIPKPVIEQVPDQSQA